MKTNWTHFRRLRKSMNWGDPDKMDPVFLHMLEAWCEFTRHKIFITPHGGTLGTHAPRSLHSIGCAADFVVPGSSYDSFLDMFISLNRFGFTEIGIYPQWRYNGEQVGGFHVGRDNRLEIEVRRKFWLGIKEENSDKNKYLGITRANLKRYGAL